MNVRLVTLLALLIPAWASGQAEQPFVRHAALSPDGTEVVFSYQGDLWTMPTTGGRPYRLTIHEAYEGAPLYSPDGKRIAFHSDRYGNDDLFVIPAEGGAPNRITFHSANDGLAGWTNDGKLLFTTNRAFTSVEWDSEIHTVNADGGTPTRMLDADGLMPSLSPDGKLLAFVRGACRVARETYTGSANKQVWIYNAAKDEYKQLTQFDGQDIEPRWGDANTLYYLSAEGMGRYNIFRQKIKADGSADGAPEAVTTYKDEGIRNFNVSANGKKAVYERGLDVFMLDLATKKAEKLNIKIGADYRFDPVEHMTMSSGLNAYAESPDGKLMALEIRGELFVTENDKEESRTVRLTRHAYRDREPTWLNDSTLLFRSDREGQYDLYLVRSADKEKPNLFKSLKHETVRLTKTDEGESDPVVSHDGKQIVFRRGNGTLVLASWDGENFKEEKTLMDGWASPSGVAWSPDDRWLAFSQEDLNFNEEVYLMPADGSAKPTNVSMHPRADSSPYWSKDGSKLGFVSARNNGDSDIWFAWLKEEDWEKTRRDWEEGDDKEEKPKQEKKEGDEDEDEGPEPMQIDLEGIHERLQQVTSLPGNESSLTISHDGETFFFVAFRSGRGGSYDADVDLYSVKWDGTERKALTQGGRNPYGVDLSNDGKGLYYVAFGGRLNYIGTSGSGAEGRPYRAMMSVNHPEERKQIYAEAWRELNARFYDPEFHGKDWKKLHDKYAKLVERTSTKRDFRYVFNLMLGEVNASHMGMYGGDRAETQTERTGRLGIEVEPMKKGVKVTRIVPDAPADRKASKLYVGDVILSVDGEPVMEGENFYRLLTNKATDKVVLEVEGKNGAREVVIRPSYSIDTELYEEWVAERKKLVEEYSGGRLGYIHIQGMNWTSFERFERELTASGLGKDGLVVDVRYNGGGWTTDYLMAVLDVRQHAYTVPRGAAKDLEKEHPKFEGYYPYGERLPFGAWTKPSVALCNANSYSNAEIFSHAYKTLGIGKLVGQPTFGAVISTGGSGLIDGSYVRIPFRGWYSLGTKANMDFVPATPDILLDNAPDSKAEGRDEQLKKATEVLLDEIEAASRK